MSVTAFSQYKVYEYANSGTPALATYTGMTFTQDGTNFLDALNTSSQSVVSMPVSYIATCDSNYRYNVSQMTAYSNIGANFPSNGGYEFENQTTKFVLKIKDLRGNIAYSKDLEIDMNTTYFGFFMNSNGIGGVIIYRINDANCDVVIKGNSTFDNMYKTVYTIDGRDPLPDLEGGGAGSGYIGNSLLSNKKMVGYNVPTSSAEGTKTESVNEASASAISGEPKSGNGFARIKFLREIGQTIIYENGVCNPAYFEDGQYKTITAVGAGGSHSVTFNSNNIEIQTSSGAYNTQRAVHTVFDGIEIPEAFTKVKIYGHITFGAISPTMGGLNFNIQNVNTNGSYDYIIEHPTVVHTDAYHIGSNGRNSWSGNNISDEYDFVWEGDFEEVSSTYGGRYIGLWTNCLHTCESLNIKIKKIVIEP